MRLVDEGDEVVREVVQHGVRRGPDGPPIDVPRVVLDAGAVPQYLEHFQVVHGALFDTLGFQQLAHALEILHPLVQFGLDIHDGPLHIARRGHVMLGRIHHRGVQLGQLVAGDRMHHLDAVQVVAPQFQSQRLLVVAGPDFQRIALGPEPARREFYVVALVLHGHQPLQNGVSAYRLAHLQDQVQRAVLLRVAQAVDAAHAGHHDGVGAGEERAGGRVPQPLDLVVDVGVLLDEQVLARHVGFRLVVVVVRDEELHRTSRKELAELGGQLGGQNLVGGHDERGPPGLLDDLGHAERFAGARRSQQCLILQAAAQAVHEAANGGRLVSGRRVL